MGVKLKQKRKSTTPVGGRIHLCFLVFMLAYCRCVTWCSFFRGRLTQSWTRFCVCNTVPCINVHSCVFGVVVTVQAGGLLLQELDLLLLVKVRVILKQGRKDSKPLQHSSSELSCISTIRQTPWRYPLYVYIWLMQYLSLMCSVSNKHVGLLGDFVCVYIRTC